MSALVRFICCRQCRPSKEYEVSGVQAASISAHDNHRVRSLSKVDGKQVSLSGATLDDTQTDTGSATVVRGSWHWENDEPQVLFVYDNYPPGFDFTSLEFFKKTLYDYEFSTEDVVFEDSVKNTKHIAIQDSAAFEATCSNLKRF